MSRPLVTDTVVRGLEFARACVLDQRASSRTRADHGWDARYQEAQALGPRPGWWRPAARKRHDRHVRARKA